MIKTIAKIEGSAAKAIYLMIRIHRTVTFQDLLNAGFGESTIYNSVKQLQTLGYILKVGKGVYRLDRYAGGLFKDAGR